MLKLTLIIFSSDKWRLYDLQVLPTRNLPSTLLVTRTCHSEGLMDHEIRHTTQHLGVLTATFVVKTYFISNLLNSFVRQIDVKVICI